MLIIDKLKGEETLTQTEKGVAQKVIELQDDLKKYSIRELADFCYVSTSVITRLCHKVGFDGYLQFKEKYLEEIKYLSEHFDYVDANLPFSKDDNLARVMASVSELYHETAKDTLSLVNYFDYIEAVKLIKRSQRVYILCIGSFIQLGHIFADRMMKIGKTIFVSDNVNEQYYQSYNSTSQDCFIIISYSGTTYKTKQFLENLKKSQAKTILITSVGESPWKKQVNVILTMTTREKLYTNIASYTTTVSTMLILDFLYSCYFYREYDVCLEHKREVAKAYEPNRTSTNIILKEE